MFAYASFGRIEFSTSCENVLLSTMSFLKVSKFSNHAFILYPPGHGAHFKE